jgi:class 3 adenylate cyclase
MPHSRPIERKLTTILAADAANFSGRMARDEEGTVRALRSTRGAIDAAITQCGGRIANTSGDGLIAEFPSVVGAVRCAVDIQATLNARKDLLPFRLGVHLGDVIVEGQDLLGDGVNLAARLQEMADVGGILISQQVFDHVRGKLSDVELRPLGPATPKHLEGEVVLYAVIAVGVSRPRYLDNLGPKVTVPPQAISQAQDLPEPDTDEPEAVAMREKFVRDRWRIGGGILALVLLDVAASPPAIVTGIPTVALIYLLYRKWSALREIENGTV